THSCTLGLDLDLVSISFSVIIPSVEASTEQEYAKFQTILVDYITSSNREATQLTLFFCLNVASCSKAPTTMIVSPASMRASCLEPGITPLGLFSTTSIVP